MMADVSVEQLQAADSHLTRAFFGCVAAVLLSLCWTLFFASSMKEQAALAALVAFGLFVLQLGFYAWYAISAGWAAKVLGATRWHYVVWILVAPLLALVPIPIVSGIIAVSPLSIKFLLGGQLQTAIREATFGQLHGA
jgi:hypothetical protein